MLNDVKIILLLFAIVAATIYIPAYIKSNFAHSIVSNRHIIVDHITYDVIPRPGS